MLFSEPKIPQTARTATAPRRSGAVSVLFSEPKIPQTSGKFAGFSAKLVSVLFSEPKIPQTDRRGCGQSGGGGFSALQRAENSSKRRAPRQARGRVGRFSALQRAENSSKQHVSSDTYSRWRFSALQRAENSSNIRSPTQCSRNCCVSVLFSEPKIPQRVAGSDYEVVTYGFSALQRAENSSKGRSGSRVAAFAQRFSALQRAENSSNRVQRTLAGGNRRVSVLFSEPKIPQNCAGGVVSDVRTRFQCSSASRKFLKAG